MRKLLLAIMLLIGRCYASQPDVYLAQTNLGANDGTSCANAHIYTFFSNFANWGTQAGRIGPGTTVHLCGIITGAAGENMLVANGSGTAGNPITIKFETNAGLEAPYFNIGIYLDGQSYFIVDGGTNGHMRNTLAGTPGITCPGGPCQYHPAGTYAIHALTCQNCEFKNLDFLLYTHQQCEGSGCDIFLDVVSGAALYGNGSNMLFHDNVMHDGSQLITIPYAVSDTGLRVYNNVAYNYNIALAGCAHGDVFVYNNHFTMSNVWDSGTANYYHHNGVHMFCDPSTNRVMQNFYFYNNLIDGSALHYTSLVFMEGGVSGWTDTTGTAYIWNNVFLGSLADPVGQLGVFAGTGNQVLNNVILSTDQSVNGTCLAMVNTGTTPAVIKNNIIQGCTTLVNMQSGNATTVALDYKAYGNAPSSGNAVFQEYIGTTLTYTGNTLAAWQSSCSCDSHSVANLTAPLAIDSVGKPLAGFIGIAAGTNLTSQATGNFASLAATTSAGKTALPVPRPATGPWDIGAYAFAFAQASSFPVINGTVVMTGSVTTN